MKHFPHGLGPGFGLGELRLRPDLDAPGSPERCRARWVAEGPSGLLWLLERLRPDQAAHRLALGRVLHALSRAGLDTAMAYEPLPGQDQEFVLPCREGLYQVSRFVLHDPLPRPGFLDQEERGRSLAGFLAKLRRAARAMDPGLVKPLPRLCLTFFVRDLLAAVKPRRPEVAERLTPALQALAPLLEAWDGLPRTLCHGDFHPLNVLWQGETVLAVIDWEFCGSKPELYDAANMIGCCGFEHPRAFGSGLVPALIRELRQHGLLTPDNASRLPLLVLGLRLAWLSEWLRKGDREMLAQELDYLDLLASSLPDMVRAWAG